jgi:pyrophosphatase PpaX
MSSGSRKIPLMVPRSGASHLHSELARPTTVLFDLDGTLIDSVELILSSARHAFEKVGDIYPSDAEWLTGLGIPLSTIFRRYAASEEQVQRLIGAYREYQMANHDRLVRCYGGTVETLRSLRERGHAIGVVTSKSDAMALRGLALVGAACLVDTVVGIQSSARHKPHPEPVEVALARLDSRPDEAVFVGDSVHDMEAGRAAGVATVGALWGPFSQSDLEPSQPTYFLNQVSELPRLLA